MLVPGIRALVAETLREPKQHSPDRHGLLDQCIAGLPVDVTEIGGDQELILGFGHRARCMLEEAQRLLHRVLATALGDVVGNRERRPSKVGCHDPAIGAREASSGTIDRHEQLARSLPDMKSSEVVHRGKLRPASTRDLTSGTHLGANARVLKPR